MRIPVTINPNTLKTYNCYNESNIAKNTLRSDNLSNWDRTLPKSLQELCLEAIAKNWEEKPILEEIVVTIDRCLLLNILPTDLPLTLTVPKIDGDVYWKRCYLQKWPKSIPENVSLDVQINEIVKVSNSRKSSEESERSRKSSTTEHFKRTWKECFLETHICEYLEKLKPEDYDAEKIKELADLCTDYVKILNIRELQCSENSPNRIPLNAITSGLENLTELSICFKQTYVGEKFTWDTVRVSSKDIRLLAKGLEKCKLRCFRLKNSDIDDEKAVIILKSLLKHELETLDFSHCRIRDYGAVAISKFCLENSVSNLILTNNRIGAKGIESLSYVICSSACNLKSLNLKLNPISQRGVAILMKPLTISARKIKTLHLNACGVGHISTLGEMIEHNSHLEHLDLSNNSLGEEMGKVILKGLRYNTTLKNLDVRMCKLNSADEFEILQRINKNRIAMKRPRTARNPIIIEPQYKFEISDELLSEIENVFQSDETDEASTELTD
ncbi:dynein regulatory complex subunit 5-like [Tribolium madens]|uniref:dynein regulatory complex subunit 5-like n=1 Tax=Tribolium madens TaxID=41895 RepID=UPI001CF75E0D|nr:dynein regulatory complex subunit 5-like [Tribolium madens]